MRRLICAFVVNIWLKQVFMTWLKCFEFSGVCLPVQYTEPRHSSDWHLVLDSIAAWKKLHIPDTIWGATWQNLQNECVPSEDSDQPGYPHSLIRVFAVRMQKAWALSYPLSARRRLSSDWADAQADLSLCWAHTHFVVLSCRSSYCYIGDSLITHSWSCNLRDFLPVFLSPVNDGSPCKELIPDPDPRPWAGCPFCPLVPFDVGFSFTRSSLSWNRKNMMLWWISMPSLCTFAIIFFYLWV